MSQPAFRVGELALMQYANYFTETDGELGIVTAPLALRRGYDLHLMGFVWVHVYRVKVLNGTDLSLLCRPWQLRKLDQDSPEDQEDKARIRQNTGQKV